MEKTDQELVERIVSRDEKALRQFYTTHKKPLFQFVLKHLNDRQDAEEVMQDTFIAFIESLRDFRGQSSLKTFLYAIARNKAIDTIRKKKIKKILFSALPQSFVESLAAVFLHEEFDRVELEKKISLVLSRLPHDYAAVLRLKYEEGYKVVEIAKKMGLPFKTTESLLFRARKAFIFIYKTYE